MFWAVTTLILGNNENKFIVSHILKMRVELLKLNLLHILLKTIGPFRGTLSYCLIAISTIEAFCQMLVFCQTFQ
jgi:hypothetical protein